MRKVIFILLAIGLLATTGTAIAEAPPEINGWTYLGKAGH